MEYILNKELIPMINGGKLNLTKIQCLISVKKFIDRIASTKYLEDNIVAKIKDTYNAKPSVITWGDYFQTELAYDLQDKCNDDFIKAVDTVKFDIISSFAIFSEKESSFFDWVEDNYNNMESIQDQISKDEYEEALHLNILKDYYCSMKILDNFTSKELSWYDKYKEAVAV